VQPIVFRILLVLLLVGIAASVLGSSLIPLVEAGLVAFYVYSVARVFSE
jgi:hypothetical protein